MDITRYFKRQKTRDSAEEESSNLLLVHQVADCGVSESVSSSQSGISGIGIGSNENSTEVEPSTNSSSDRDVGRYMDVVSHASLTDDDRVKLITEPWTPGKSYNFHNDLQEGQKRPFIHNWLELEKYKYWLVYSAHVRGAICRHCVLFRPAVRRGVQGSFIVKPFTKYKDMHASCENHVKSEWHREAVERSKSFMDAVTNRLNVREQIDTAYQERIKRNREKLSSILSSIIFCGTHDLPLRGKLPDSGVFRDLLSFRAEAGDSILKEHLETCSENAKYTSAQTQNELIALCSEKIKEQIVKDVNASYAFSIIADETADIAGTEQLSLGVRFVSNKYEGKATVREEFLGFVPLNELNAEAISKTILSYLSKIGIDMSNMIGQGYDGCSVMSGKVGGVAKLIREKYPKAMYLHCSSHKLNLVVNDLNQVQDIRNACGIIKEIIRFFRESSLRRRLIPNIPLLCETRWSAKYKSIRVFSEKYKEIIYALEELEVNGNTTTKQRASQLLCSATNSTFIVALHVIALYSGMLEPVSNILQGVTIDMHHVRGHIRELIEIFKKHRQEAATQFKQIMQTVREVTSCINIEITVPRQASRQCHRQNYQMAKDPEEYYRFSLFIPYLESLISSLEIRFSENNAMINDILKLHPANMKRLNSLEFGEVAKKIQDYYNIENFLSESKCWFDSWQNKSEEDSNRLHLIDVFEDTKVFFPAVSKIINIALALPATTCTAERSFSTLRRVKTWLRATMDDERLDGLCMLSVHRERVSTQLSSFIEEVITAFSRRRPRRLQFVFKD